MDYIVIIIVFIIFLGFISSLSLLGGFFVYTVSEKKDNKTMSEPKIKALASSSLQNKTESVEVTEIKATQRSSNLPKQNLLASSGINRMGLDCTADLGDKYTCTNPLDSKKIKLKNGNVVKISSSTESDGYNKTQDFYLMVPYIFIVDTIVNLGTRSINVRTLDDLLVLFERIDARFDTETKVRNKCMNIGSKTRNESKPPYNTTCIFFPGLSKIEAISNTLEKSFLPSIPENVLNEYFNLVDSKIKRDDALTFMEYIMYLALLNKLKKSNYKYYTTCTSDSVFITC